MGEFIGTEADESWTGTSDADFAQGNGGNDTIDGLQGADTLEGGEGNDTLASQGRSLYAPWMENVIYDTLFFYSTDDGTEQDTLIGGNGNDRLFAGYGDTVTGGAGNNILSINLLGATSGVVADFRLASSGTLVIGGGAISGITSVDSIIGSNFDDTIQSLGTSAGRNSRIFGGGGNDTIVTGRYDGYVHGGEGDDMIDARGNTSPRGMYIYGDAGNDTIIMPLVKELSAAPSALPGSLEADGGGGDDTITGGYSVNGGDGNDHLSGMGDIVTGIGSYSANGGAGDDEITLAGLRRGRLFGGTGADTIQGGGGADRIGSDLAFSANIPSDSSEGDDAGAEHDILDGMDGDDIISAGWGDDVDGGTGTDILRLTLTGSSTGVVLNTASLTGTFVLGGGTIQGIETVSRLVGSSHADTITIAPGSAPLTVEMGAGDDMLVYGAGVQYMRGGDGSDTLDLGAAIAAVSISIGNHADQVASGPAGSQITGFENFIGTAFDDTFVGSDGTNLLRGMDGADRLRGLDGNDRLEGGLGDDSIQGGDGLDTAVFSGAASAYTITQLSGGEWRIEGPDGTDTISGIERLEFSDQVAVLHVSPSFGAVTLVSDGFSHPAGWLSNLTNPRTAADVNGDGRSDLVGFGNDGVYAQISRGDGSFDPVTRISDRYGSGASSGGWSSNELYPRVVGDTDGDGRADFVGFGNAGVILNGNLVLSAFGVDQGWTSARVNPRLLADVDGDGRDDIVGFGVDGVTVALATPGDSPFGAATNVTHSFGSSAQAGGWDDEGHFPRTLADINGDGMADIVGFGYDGVYAALATGNGNFGPIYQAHDRFGMSDAAGGWANDNLFPRMLADVNGDQTPDIVGFGYDGVWVALATGQGQFGTAELVFHGFGAGSGAGGWNDQDQFPRIVADVTGDGLGDLIGFGYDGVYMAVGSAAGTGWDFI